MVAFDRADRKDSLAEAASAGFASQQGDCRPSCCLLPVAVELGLEAVRSVRVHPTLVLLDR